MPIRINLLAEAKIAEELRRRDPVKRAIYVGIFLVVFTLVWSTSLQLEVIISKKDLSRVEAGITTRSNEFQTVLISQRKITEIKSKLNALQKLNEFRFLQGNCLNALQLSTLDGVSLVRIRVSQAYDGTPAVPSKKDGDRIIPPKPATASEKTTLILDAKDLSASPGDAVEKFKENIARQSYFKAMLIPTNSVKLISLSSPQFGPDTRPYVSFNLECYFPTKNQ